MGSDMAMLSCVNRSLCSAIVRRTSTMPLRATSGFLIYVTIDCKEVGDDRRQEVKKPARGRLFPLRRRSDGLLRQHPLHERLGVVGARLDRRMSLALGKLVDERCLGVCL